MVNIKKPGQKDLFFLVVSWLTFPQYLYLYWSTQDVFNTNRDNIPFIFLGINLILIFLYFFSRSGLQSSIFLILFRILLGVSLVGMFVNNIFVSIFLFPIWLGVVGIIYHIVFKRKAKVSTDGTISEGPQQ